MIFDSEKSSDSCINQNTKTETFALLLCTDPFGGNVPLERHTGRATRRGEGVSLPDSMIGG
ncbi:MAG: hypothetical protein K2N90_10645 [Lachnospiraceae bacterium]|nr:hypothetical protein [Lachnospiraceae bacterium]